jgi:hypothetical protein
VIEQGAAFTDRNLLIQGFLSGHTELRPSGMSRDVLRWEGLTLRLWSAESNLGKWALYLSQHAQHVLILSGSWGGS